MERVVHQGEADRVSFYFNTTDIAVLQHYCGLIPEEFTMTVVASDDVPAGTVALDNFEYMPTEHRAALTEYWEDGVRTAHIMARMDVAAAKHLAEHGTTDEAIVMVMTDDGEIEFVDTDEYDVLFEDLSDDELGGEG